jgi:MSHA biogenesis protein MshP
MSVRLRENGFAYIAAVIFLVVLAGFALAVLRLQNAQQATIDGSILGMRAEQAARGGLEWAFYQLRDGKAAACTNTVDNATRMDFVQDTGFKVTLTCAVQTYNEGEDYDSGARAPQKKNIFELTATACNGAGAACPDAAAVAGRDYVERKRSASLCGVEDNKKYCY